MRGRTLAAAAPQLVGPARALSTNLGAALAEARLGRRRAAAHPGFDAELAGVEAGYAAAADNHAALDAAGWPVAGYKVGATSSAAQARMGMTRPFWGRLYAPATVRFDSAPASGARPAAEPPHATSRSHPEPQPPHAGAAWHPTRSAVASRAEAQRFSISESGIRGVEAEFAFVLRRDVAPRAGGRSYDADELLEEYVDCVMPSVEVCGTRAPADAKASAGLLVADGAGNERVLLGWDAAVAPAKSVAAQLASQPAEVLIDGAVVASGLGREVLGSPETSLAWFVNEVVQGGPRVTLRAHQFVITGAICGLVPVTKACYVRLSFPQWRGGGWVADLAFRP